jgi:hypothetical protein
VSAVRFDLCILGIVALLFISCSDCPSGTICECVGDLTVTVHLTNVPAKLQLRWKGNVVVDECAALRQGSLTYEKRGTELVINDGGFGYTPPSMVDLEIVDLKDCSQAPESLFAVVDEPVPGAPFPHCSRASLDV